MIQNRRHQFRKWRKQKRKEGGKAELTLPAPPPPLLAAARPAPLPPPVAAAHPVPLPPLLLHRRIMPLLLLPLGLMLLLLTPAHLPRLPHGHGPRGAVVRAGVGGVGPGGPGEAGDGEGAAVEEAAELGRGERGLGRRPAARGVVPAPVNSVSGDLDFRADPDLDLRILDRVDFFLRTQIFFAIFDLLYICIRSSVLGL